jgi:hypothetical protein
VSETAGEGWWQNIVKALKDARLNALPVTIYLISRSLKS